MKQYKAKSTLVDKGNRYQAGKTFSEKDLKELSDGFLSKHFIEVLENKDADVKVDKVIEPETDSKTDDTDADVKVETLAPAPKGKGKGKNK